MNIGRFCTDSIIDHGVNELNNRSAVNCIIKLRSSLLLILRQIGIELFSRLGSTLFSVIDFNGIDNGSVSREHQSDLISGLELKLVFNCNVHRVIDSDNQVVVVETNRQNYVVFAEFLIQKCRCLRININARQVNNRVIILTGHSTQDVKF